MLNYLDGTPAAGLRAKIAEIWHGVLKPEAATADVAGPVLAFLEERMLANNPTGLVTMASHLLKAEDKTAELAARGIPAFVLYGEDDNAWPTAQQRDMAAGSARSAPAFPAPRTTPTSRPRPPRPTRSPSSGTRPRPSEPCGYGSSASASQGRCAAAAACPSGQLRR